MKRSCITAAVAGLLIASLSAILSTSALAGDVATQKQPQNPADCLLILEGKHIEKLVLRDKQGRITELVHPAARVTLPAGEYQIEAIEVEGGYHVSWSLPPYSSAPRRSGRHRETGCLCSHPISPATRRSGHR